MSSLCFSPPTRNCSKYPVAPCTLPARLTAPPPLWLGHWWHHIWPWTGIKNANVLIFWQFYGSHNSHQSHTSPSMLLPGCSLNPEAGRSCGSCCWSVAEQCPKLLQNWHQVRGANSGGSSVSQRHLRRSSSQAYPYEDNGAYPVCLWWPVCLTKRGTSHENFSKAVINSCRLFSYHYNSTDSVWIILPRLTESFWVLAFTSSVPSINRVKGGATVNLWLTSLSLLQQDH